MIEVFDNRGACTRGEALIAKWNELGLATLYPYVSPFSGLGVIGIRLGEEAAGAALKKTSLESYGFIDEEMLGTVGQTASQKQEAYRLIVPRVYNQGKLQAFLATHTPTKAYELEDHQSIVNRTCAWASTLIIHNNYFNPLVNKPELLELVNYIGVALRVEDCFKKPFEA